MFSSKFGERSGAPTLQWERYQALRKAGHPLLDLTVSNPTTVGLEYPEEIPALLAHPSLLEYRPSPQGDLHAREAVSAYYRSRGRICAPEDLILTASTSEAYAFLFKLLCDPGDEVLIPSPTYPLFDALAELENVTLVRYPLRLAEAVGGSDGKAHWRGDMGFLRSLVSTRCKALVLVNPDNPTGRLADAEEIEACLSLARDFGLALIVDEVFSEYLLGSRPHLPVTSTGPLVFTLNGFSKLLGLPQLKLAWIHVAGAEAAVARARENLEWISDAFLSVNTPVQRACPGLLDLGPVIRSSISQRLETNLATAHRLLPDPGISQSDLLHTGSFLSSSSLTGPRRVRFLPPEAGWSLILDLDLPLSDEDFALSLLEAKKIHVHSGHLFGFEEGCRLVLSLLVTPEFFREGLEGILAHAEECSHG